jgi:FKBP-type peptidyl-prolyl cis-trans isomerase
MHKLLLHLREGDKVQALIPSYLGYGVAGDGNKVPPKATLVYNFEILKVQNQPH